MNYLSKELREYLNKIEQSNQCNISYDEFKSEFLKQLRNYNQSITSSDINQIDLLCKICYKSMRTCNLLQSKNDEIWKQLLSLFMLTIFETICELDYNIEKEKN